VFVACYTLGLLTLAYTIAWLHRHYQIPKGKDCGRKEAFSKTFMTYIYSADALGFILA
jgi:hypothetical protein